MDEREKWREGVKVRIRKKESDARKKGNEGNQRNENAN